MKSVDRIPALLITDNAYLICRVDVGFSVKPTSLRVLLPVRTEKQVKVRD